MLNSDLGPPLNPDGSPVSDGGITNNTLTNPPPVPGNTNPDPGFTGPPPVDGGNNLPNPITGPGGSPLPGMSNLNSFTGNGSNIFSNPMFLASMATAYQQYRDAGKYTDLGNQAAQTANPFGQYRPQFGQDLSNLEKDPSSIVNTPGYKFALNQALDSTQARMAASGLSGSSSENQAVTAQASGLAQQTYNSTIAQLSNLAGAQFDPANAARMRMQGGEMSMQAQSNALHDMFVPFAPGAGGNTTVNNGAPGNTPGGGVHPGGTTVSPGASGIKFSGLSPSQLAGMGMTQIAPGVFQDQSGTQFAGDGSILPDPSMQPGNGAGFNGTFDQTGNLVGSDGTTTPPIDPNASFTDTGANVTTSPYVDTSQLITDPWGAN